jgi:hypothetical protein
MLQAVAVPSARANVMTRTLALRSMGRGRPSPKIQELSFLPETPPARKFDPNNPLHRALMSLGHELGVSVEVKE